MNNITVITPGEECRHNFIQAGKRRFRYDKPYYTAEFQCEFCGRKRSFATDMTGYWLANARTEGGIYV
ncbi:MAG: hypothetical protein LWY06_05080 [Firmicutes bacterium]|nr:hypothetical protein [Bacillota bacterium]